MGETQRETERDRERERKSEKVRWGEEEGGEDDQHVTQLYLGSEVATIVTQELLEGNK